MMSMEEGVAAGVELAMENPLMKLSAISQAMSNLANVATAAHQIGADIDKVIAAHQDAVGLIAILEQKATNYLRLRDDALSRITSLMEIIKDER